MSVVTGGNERLPGSEHKTLHLTPELAGRIAVMVSAIVMLLLISPLLRVPEVILPVSALGSPLRVQVSAALLAGIAAAIIAWVGSHSILSLHPEYLPGTKIYSHRLLPALMALAACIFWHSQSNLIIEQRLLVAAIIGVGLSLVAYGQYVAMAGDSTWLMRLRTVLSIISLGIGMYLMIMAYSTRVRSLVTATAISLLAFILAVDVLQYDVDREWRMLRAATVIGLIAGQCAWALNYWRISPLQAGFILLVVVYVLVGLVRRLFQGSLTRLAVLEHFVMAILLLLVMQRVVG